MVVSKFKPTVSASCAVAIQLLKAVDSAADGFGALKAVTGPALFIAESVQDYQSHRKDWLRFSEYVQETLVTLLQRIHDAQSYDKGALLRDMEKLRDALNEIQKKIEKYQRKRCKWWYFVTKPQFIEQLRKDFMEAIAAFKMEISMTSALNVAEIQRLLEEDNLKPFLEKLDLHLTRVMTAINLVNLPVAGKKSTYNYDNCCLEGTRICVLKDILDWLSDGDAVNKPRIRLLTDVAGSGKSAVAHSMARLCKEKGILASSFFFDREIAGQNDTTKLFTSIAHDLAKLDERLATEISNALAKQSARNCLCDEFQYFILDPLTRCPIPGPRAIVIDALDEGYDVSLLRLLKDDINKLPPNFCIFITSRPEPTIMRHLEFLPHLDISDLDIDGDENRADISRYSRFRLHGLSELRRIPDWPVEQQRRDFELKAEGLMLFVSTLVDFLEYTPNPERQLKLLLLDHTPKNHTSTSRMDQLYAGITSHCFWDDPTFVSDYQAVVGIVVAAKKPLTMTSLQALLDTSVGNEIRAQNILRETPLRTLLLGCTKQSQPVKTLHLSFREFLTNSEFPTTFVDERQHNRRLALLCLNLLNQQLVKPLPGLGYLAVDVPHDPLPPFTLPADLEYACLFWIEHLEAYEDLAEAPELVSALKEFLSRHVIAWLEITISVGKFQSLLDDRILHSLELMSPNAPLDFLHPDLPDTLHRATKRLATIGRQDEAYQSSLNTIHFMRLRVGLEPTVFDPPLGFALIGHIRVLVHTFRYQDAIVLSRESLEWLAAVAVTDDRAYLTCRSRILHNMSVPLNNLGRKMEAIEAVKEAIRIQETLPLIEDYEMLRDLPFFMLNLARYLQQADQVDEAVLSATRAVSLYRQYARSIPDFQIHLIPALTLLSNLSATYPDRAHSALDLAEEAVNLSSDLITSIPSAECELPNALRVYASRLDSTDPEEAIRITERAIELLRKQTRIYSGTFRQQLGLTLHSLCSRLLVHYRYEAALEAITECIAIQRSLQEDDAQMDQDLGSSLLLYSHILFTTSVVEAALPPARESVDRYKAVCAISDDEQVRARLGTALEHLCQVLAVVVGRGLAKSAELLAPLSECAGVYRELHKDNPSFLIPLARSLRELYHYYMDEDEGSPEAPAARREIFLLGNPKIPDW